MNCVVCGFDIPVPDRDQWDVRTDVEGNIVARTIELRCPSCGSSATHGVLDENGQPNDTQNYLEESLS